MSEVHRASKLITLAVTCLGTFMVLLDTTIIVTALPGSSAGTPSTPPGSPAPGDQPGVR